MRNARKAEMGVGTLIIFIALLLVAAVAAGVLIQTAGSLQQRALSTGSQSTSQISTNAVVLEVSGEDGRNVGIENFSMIMKLAPGSDPIRLEGVSLMMNTVDTTTSYIYSNASAPVVDAGNNNGTFVVEYLQQGSSSDAGLLVRGDVIRVDFFSQAEIGAAEYVRINFIPQVGTPTQVIFETPNVMSTQRVYLYP